MRAKKLYKPNVVYVVEIHGYQYYVGCHCQNRELTESNILNSSGNPLRVAYQRKLITSQEYLESCKLVHIEEYDTKEEALNREAELIKRFKDFYGNRCLNKSNGNIFGGTTGVSPSEETKKKISESHINNQKLSKRVQQYTKDGKLVAEYPSIMEASRQTGVSFSNISLVVSKTSVKCTKKGKIYFYTPKSAGGYLWESA